MIDYLPNAIKITKYQDNKITKKRGVAKLLYCYLAFTNKIAYWLQYFYMRPKITNERISRYQAFFHPALLRGKIESEFKLRSKRYNINDD